MNTDEAHFAAFHKYYLALCQSAGVAPVSLEAVALVAQALIESADLVDVTYQ